MYLYVLIISYWCFAGLVDSIPLTQESHHDNIENNTSRYQHYSTDNVFEHMIKASVELYAQRELRNRIAHENSTHNYWRKSEFIMDRGKLHIQLGKLKFPKTDFDLFAQPFWLRYDPALDLLVAMPFLIPNYLKETYADIAITSGSIHLNHRLVIKLINEKNPAQYFLHLSLHRRINSLDFGNILRFVDVIDRFSVEYHIHNNVLPAGTIIHEYQKIDRKKDNLVISFDQNCPTFLFDLTEALKHQTYIEIIAMAVIQNTSSRVQNCYLNQYVSLNDDKIQVRKDPPSRVRRNLPFFALQNLNLPNPLSQNCEQNTNPLPKARQIKLKILPNQFNHIVLSDDLFSDAENGNMRRLQVDMKWASGRNIMQSDWLQYSSVLQFIYTWATYDTLIHQPTEGYHFLLIAKDSCNATSTMNLRLIVENVIKHPPCHHFALIAESKMDVNTPYIHVLIDLLNIVRSQFNDTKLEKILVTKFQNLLSVKNTFTLSLSDQSITCTPCDVNAIKTELFRVRASTSASVYLPNFKFLGLTVDLQLCSSNSPPIVLCPIPVLNIPSNRLIIYRIPQNTFYDAEDGFLDNMKLAKTSLSNSVLLFLHGKAIYIYQIVYTNVIGSLYYRLEAADSSGMKAVISFEVKTSDSNLLPYVWFQMRFLTYFSSSISNGALLQQILIKLTQFVYGNEDMSQIGIILFERQGVYPQNIKIQWTDVHFYEYGRNNTTFLMMKNKLFDGNVVSNQFKVFMSPFITNIEGRYFMKDDEISLTPTPTISSSFSLSINSAPFGTIHVSTVIKPTTSKEIKTTSLIDPSAPTAKFNIGPFMATFCDFFVYPIPEDLFYDKIDGNTRNVTLSLHTKFYQPVTRDSWLQLDENIQVLYGFLKVSDYVTARGKRMEYNLVARNSRGLRTSLLFFINLPKKQPTIFYTIAMTVSAFYDPTAPDINEQLLLLLKISSYFGEAKFSWVNILSFSRDTKENYVTFAWTNCTITTETSCPKTAVESLSSKVVLSNGMVNSKFAGYFAPQYIIKDITASINVNCDKSTVTTQLPSSSVAITTKPSIINTIPLLKISANAYFKYTIPYNTFYDNSDGYTPYLSLSMVNMDGSSLLGNSWIQFNKGAQEMYASLYIDVLENEPKKLFKFLLIATNSHLKSVGLTITIECSRDRIPIGGMTVKVSGEEHYSLVMNDLQVFTMFLQKYNRFMGMRNNLEIKLFTRETNGEVGISLVYDRVTLSNECDITSINEIKSRILDQEENIIPTFSNTFLPDFTIANIQIENFGICKGYPLTTTPSTMKPIILTPIPLLNAKTSTVFQYHVPVTAFYDQVDGTTRNLKLSLHYQNQVLVSHSNWLQLLPGQNLFGVLTSKDVGDENHKTFVYVLRASNSKGYHVDMQLNLVGLNELKGDALKIVISGKSLYSTHVTNPQILNDFSTKLHMYLYGVSSSSQTGFSSFQMQSSPGNLFQLTFQDNRLTKETCLTSAYTHVMNKLFSDDNQNINTQFIIAMYPKVSVTNLIVQGTCDKPTTTKPPTTTQKPVPIIVNPIPMLQVNSNHIFKYQIPSTTFHDPVDGYTRNLKLSLHYINEVLVLSTNWLQLLSNQSLLGVLTVQDFGNEKHKTFRYILRATNNKGYYVDMQVTLNGLNELKSNAFKIVISGQSFYSNQFTHPQILNEFSTKLHMYLYGVSSSSQTGFVSFQMQSPPGNLFQLAFQDNRLTKETCMTSAYTHVMEKLYSDGQNINAQFIMAMYPKVSVTNLIVQGTCGKTTTAKPPTTTQKPVPTIVNPIPMLQVNSNRILKYQIPSTTFSDPVDGYTRNLKLSLHYTNEVRVLSTNWLQLLSDQSLLGVLMVQDFGNEKHKTFRYILRATNSKGYYADMQIVLLALNELKNDAFKIMISGQSFYSNQFTHPQILDQFSTKLHMYLYGVSSSSQTGFSSFQMQSPPGNLFQLTFQDNRLTKETCLTSAYTHVMNKLFSNGQHINTQFIMAMYPKVSVTNLIVQGTCDKPTTTKPPTTTQKPVPIIVNPIPMLQVNSNHIFKYQIPSTTFHDSVDGYTRNLKLSLHYINEVLVLSTDWLQLLSDQSLLGVLTVQDFGNEKHKTFRYILRATNNKGYYVDMQVTLHGLNELKNNAFKVVISGQSFYSRQFTHPQILNDFSTKLHMYLYGVSSSSQTGFSSFHIQSPPSNLFQLTFQDNRLTKETCLTSTYTDIMDKLFSNGQNINTQFIIAMYPKVSVTNVIVQGTCNKPTTTKPPTTTQKPVPTIVNPIPMLQVNSNHILKYQIPSTTFSDPVDGYTKNLKLSLHYTNEVRVLSTNWLQLLSDQSLLGVLTVEEFGKAKHKTFRYILRATNSKGYYVDMHMTLLGLNELKIDAFKIVISGQSFYPSHFTYPQSLNELSTKLHMYLYGVSSSNHTGFESFSMQSPPNNFFELAFQDNRLTIENCFSKLYAQIMEKLFSDGHYINSQFILAMYPMVSLTNVTVLGECVTTTTSTLKPTTKHFLPPIVYQAIPTLYPQLYSVFVFQVPLQTFYDYNDGYTKNLNLRLVNIDDSELSLSSWLQFNATEQSLTGVVQDEVLYLSRISYKLIATNRFGLSTSQILHFEMPQPMSISHYFLLSFIVSPSQEKDLDAILIAINKIQEYITEIIQLRILEFKREAHGLLSLKWTFKTASMTCDLQTIERYRSYFFWSGDYIKSSFIQAMHPVINVGQLTFSYEQYCHPTSTLSPTSTIVFTTQPPKINISPVILKQVPTLRINRCNRLYYKIPEDAFFDVEDGLTRNLHIQVVQSDGSPLPSTSWIFFNSSKQILTGVLTDNEAAKQFTYYYKIVATDSGGLSISQVLKLTVQEQNIEEATHIFESTGSLYWYMEQSELLCLIMDSLYGYIAEKNTSWTGIKLHSVTLYGELNQYVNIRWSVCGFTCSEPMKIKLLGLILSRQVLKNEFVLLMKPAIIITDTKVTGSCGLIKSSSTQTIDTTTSIILKPTPTLNTHPIIYQVIPVLTITRCQTFHYEIPAKTCYDKESGWTRNLQMKLLFTNHTEIGHHYWIHLNPTTQSIYGILKESDIKTTNNNIFSYILVCLDPQNLSATQRIHIVFKETLEPPPYSIDVQSYVYSTYYKSYAEIQLLWIQKLSKYFNETSNSEVQIKSFTKSSVLYPQMLISWYNCSITDPCSDKALKLKSHLLQNDGVNTEFSKAMVPEFVLISVKFKSDKICVQPTSTVQVLSSSVSVNTPPIALITQLQINVHPCGKIIWQVPSNTFYDHEDGYTPSLQLTMLTMEGDPIPNDFYLKLNETQTVYGVFVYETYKTFHKFRLLAKDSGGAYAQTTISINLNTEYVPFSHKFFARAYIYTKQMSYIALLNTFKSKVLAFYTDQDENMLINTAEVSENHLEISWLNCSLATLCATKELQKTKSKIILYDSIINAEFIASLAPTFVISFLQFEYGTRCKSIVTIAPSSRMLQTTKLSMTSIIKPTPSPVINTPPVVMRPPSHVEVTVCSPFSYRIPINTFHDAEQGNTRNLKLTLLTFNKNPLPKSSWIQFVESTQVVYGHPRVFDMKFTKSYLNFILKATDKYGETVSTVLTIVLPKKPSINFQMNITVTSFFDAQTPDLTAQLFLVSKICSYVGDLDITKVLVVSFKRTSSQVNLVWTNCTLHNQCDPTASDNVVRKFIANNQVKPEFQEFLTPYYIVQTLTSNISRYCSVVTSSMYIQPTASTKLPVTSVMVDNAPRLNFTISPIFAELCSSFSYHIPPNLFIDEDGQTSALSLELFYLNGSMLSKTEWIQFNSELQIVYGLLKVADIEKQPVNGYRYLLIATDSKSQSTVTVLPFQKLMQHTTIGFSITMLIRCSYVNGYPYVNDLYQIINKIAAYFHDSNPDTVKAIDLVTSNVDPNVIIFTWINCTFDFIKGCPTDAVSNIVNKLTKPDGEILMAVKKIFKPQYSLEGVEFNYQLPCIKPTSSPTPFPGESPYIKRYIRPITLKRCSQQTYRIPIDTFQDDKDGDTRSLKLSLTFPNDSAIATSYWIQFDKITQTIIASTTRIKQGISSNNFQFKLTATDSDDFSVTMTIEIIIESQSNEIFQNITLQLALNFKLNLPEEEMKGLLSSRISHFYNDADQNYIDIVDFSRNVMLISITWTNCSANQISCNATLLKWIQNQIMDTDGKCRTQFSFIFLPEFTVRDLSIQYHPSCNLTVSPSSTIAPSKTSAALATSTIIPVPKTVFALRNLSISFSYCGSVNYLIPRDAFYDSHNLNRGDLSFSLLYSDGLDLNCGSWIQLKDNHLYGIPVISQSNYPRKYLVKAQNQFGSYAQTDMEFYTDVQPSEINYKMAFSFLVNLNSTVCNSDILHIFLNKIATYFHDSSDDNITVLYYSRGDRSLRSYVMIGNCTLRTDVCDFLKVNQLSEMLYEGDTPEPNHNLVNILLPEFRNLSVLDDKEGPCSKNKVLAVGGLPDSICADPCGEFSYKLPNDTFSDPEDGNVDNLIVEMTMIDRSPLPKDSWVHFDLSTKTLHGMPSESTKKNQPKDGYSYLLTAYDLGGAAAETVINIKICGDLPSYESSITLEYQCSGNTNNTIENVIAILYGISHKYLDGTLDTVFLINFKTEANNKILFTWANCTSNQISIPVGDLNFPFTPDCQPLNQTEHDNKDYPPTTNVTSIRLKPRYCSENVYHLPSNAFYDKESKTLEISITYQNGTLIHASDWIGFLRSNSRLYIIPTNDTKIGAVYKYYYVGKDEKNQTAKIPLYIELFEEFPTLNYLMKVEYKPFYDAPITTKIDAYFTKIRDFTKSNSTLVVSRYDIFSNNTIILEYGNCSIPTTSCDYSSIEENKNTLLSKDGSINPDLFTYMFPDCVLENLSTRKLGMCLLPPNAPPVVTTPTINLTVPQCGYLKYQIPEQTFIDEEDGTVKNLTLKLFAKDSCWFEFDPEGLILYAMVTQEAIANQKTSGYMFILQATDLRGESVNATIYILFQEYPRSSFEFVFLFELGTAEFSCLKQRLLIVDKLDMFFEKNSSFAIKSLSKAADTTFIEVVIISCALRYTPCDYISIDKMLQKIEDESGTINADFSRHMQPEFTPKYITKRRGQPCVDSSNKEPFQNASLNLPNITSCYHGNLKLPPTLVYDVEDGRLENLIISLLNASTGFRIDNTSWIYLDPVSKSLLIIPTKEFAQNTPSNGYEFVLVAEDSRNAKVRIEFSVAVHDFHNVDTFTVREHVAFKKDMKSLPELLIDWKNKTESLIKQPIEILLYNIISNGVIVEWKLCQSRICNARVLKQIESLSKDNVNILNVTKFNACLFISPPNVTSNMTVLVKPCQKLHYQLLETLFQDSKDGGTSNLTVVMKQTYPAEMADTMHYDEKTQTITGVVVLDFFQRHQYIEYEATATNSEYLNSSTYIRFQLDRIYETEYEIEVGMFYFSAAANNKLSFLSTFCDKTLSYLELAQKGILITNVTQVLSNDNSIQYMVTFTPCSLLEDCKTREVERVNSLILSEDGKPKYEYYSKLLEKIALQTSVIRKTTECQTPPPTIGTPIEILRANICSSLNYKLPNNTFISELNLTVALANGESFTDWIRFDVSKQTLEVKSTINELLRMPEKGYVLIFVATDTDGRFATQNATLLIEDTADSFNFFVEAKLKLLAYSFQSYYKLRLYIEERFKGLVANQIPEVKVVNVSSIINGDIVVTLYDCSVKRMNCDPFENEKFYRVFVDLQGTLQPRISQGLLPEFQLLNVDRIEQNKCKNVSVEKPYTTDEIPKLNLTLCQKLQYKLPDRFFMDFKDGELTGNAIKLCTLDNQIVSIRDPIQYDASKREIYGFITQRKLNEYRSSQILYLLKATDSDNNEIDVLVQVNLPAKLTNNFIINVKATKEMDGKQADVNILLNFLTRMYLYFEDSSEDTISIVDFNRTSLQAVDITWTNCSLLDKCRKKDVDYISSKIFDVNGAYDQNYLRALGNNNGFIDAVTTSTTAKTCTNSIVNQTININITTCGDFSYNLMDDIFIGKEDGSNLKFTLKFLDGNPIPDTYWIQYDDDQKQLFGFPDDNALQNSELQLVLEAIDTNGEKTLIYVFVYVNKTEEQLIIREFQVRANGTCNSGPLNNQSSTLIEDVLELLSTVASQLNISLNEIHLIDYFTVNQTRNITFGFHTCKNVNFTNFTKVLNETSKKCQIVDYQIVNRSDITTTLSPSRPPIKVNDIPTIIFTCGIPYRYTIPETTFFDSKDGSTSNLTLTLLNENLVESTSSYVDLIEKNIFFFVSIENCNKVIPGPTLVIKATNSDGLSVMESFGVKKIKDTVSCCIYVSVVVSNFTNTSQYYYEYFTDLETLYNDTNNDLTIIAIKQNETAQIYMINHTNRTITNETCFENQTQYLSSAVIDQQTEEVLETFKKNLKRFNVIDAKVIKRQECNATNTSVVIPPPVVPPPSSGALVTSEEWLYYLIPLFVLAFMLLAICLCYYCCRWCFNVCCLKSNKKRNAADTPEQDLLSTYSDIPKDDISEGSLAGDVAPQSWDVDPNTLPKPSEGPPEDIEVITAPVSIKPTEAARSLDFPDKIYSQPIKRSSIKQRLRSNLDKSDPVTTSYMTQVTTTNQNDFLNQSIIRNRVVQDRRRSSVRTNLRLPSIPTGPPPPYSPPRKTRIVKQNILPEYYNKYVQSRRAVTKERQTEIPLERLSHRRSFTDIVHPSSRRYKKIVTLPSIHKLKRVRTRKRKPVEIIEIPIDSPTTITTVSDTSIQTERYESDSSSVEVQAILRGKESAIKRILKRSPKSLTSTKRKRKSSQAKYEVHMLDTIQRGKKRKVRKLPSLGDAGIEIIRRGKSRRPRASFDYKFTEPFLYNYIPVQNKSTEYTVEKTSPTKVRVRSKGKRQLPTLDELLETIDENNKEVQGLRRKLPTVRRDKTVNKQINRSSSSKFHRSLERDRDDSYEEEF